MGSSGQSGLPPGGNVGQVVTNTGPGVGTWQGATTNVLNAESQASVLVNATSAGDAGGRADHFGGNALNAKWVIHTADVQNKSVGNSMFTYLPNASSFGNYIQAYTPTDAFRVEARLFLNGDSGGAGALGLAIFDSALDESGNGIRVETSTAGQAFYSLDSGVWTSRNTAGLTVSRGQFVYLFVSRNASNQFSAGISFDRNNWVGLATNYAKTFTVGGVALRQPAATGNWYVGWDFFDVVS